MFLHMSLSKCSIFVDFEVILSVLHYFNMEKGKFAAYRMREKEGGRERKHIQMLLTDERPNSRQI